MPQDSQNLETCQMLETYQILENKMAYQWSAYGGILKDRSGLDASAAYYATRYISRLTSLSLNYYQQKRLRRNQEIAQVCST